MNGTGAGGFTTAVEPHVALMYRAALSVLGDRHLAADAVQEALFRAWRAFDRLPADANVAGWLRRIAEREALRLMRLRGRSLLLPQDLPAAAPWADPAEALLQAAERDGVRRALAALPTVQRLALEGHYGAGLPVKAIAAAAGMPPGTVKSHLHRGRAALRASLLRQGVIEVHTPPEPAVARLEALVRQLEAAGVVGDPSVAAALRAVPRHAFLPNLVERAHRTPTGGWTRSDGDPDPRPLAAAPTATGLDVAYADRWLRVGAQRGRVAVCPSPGWAATLLRALEVRPGHRIAEVGSGTGYITALLCRLTGHGGEVTTNDADDALAELARCNLAPLRREGYRVLSCYGDGAMLASSDQVLDRVLATGIVGDVSPYWWGAYAPGAVVVVPVEVCGLAVLVRMALEKDAAGDLVLRGRGLGRVPDTEAEGGWVAGVLGNLGGPGPGAFGQGMTQRSWNAFHDRWEAIFRSAALEVPVAVPPEAREPGRADGLRLFARLHRPDCRIGGMRPAEIRLVDLNVEADLVADVDTGVGRLTGNPAVLEGWNRLVGEWLAAGAPGIGDFTVAVPEPAATPAAGRWPLRATWHTWTVDIAG